MGTSQDANLVILRLTAMLKVKIISISFVISLRLAVDAWEGHGAKGAGGVEGAQGAQGVSGCGNIKLKTKNI